jgi:hypothetical protein
MYPVTWAEDGRLVIDWEHPTKIYPGAIGPTVILDTVMAISELSTAESDYPDLNA